MCTTVYAQGTCSVRAGTASDARARARWPPTKRGRLATTRIASAYLYVGAHGKPAGEARGRPQRRREPKMNQNYQNLFQKWAHIGPALAAARPPVMLQKQHRGKKLNQNRVRAAVQSLARNLAHFSPAVRKSGGQKADRAKWPRHTTQLGGTAPRTRRAKASVGLDPSGAAFLQSETPSGPITRAALTNERCLCRSPPISPYCRPRAATDARA